MKKSLDKATLQMIDVAREEDIQLTWDRYQKQLPQCGFGELGLCCRHCMQGPCRIDIRVLPRVLKVEKRDESSHQRLRRRAGDSAEGGGQGFHCGAVVNGR